jgi:hypothetical protein
MTDIDHFLDYVDFSEEADFIYYDCPTVLDVENALIRIFNKLKDKEKKENK